MHKKLQRLFETPLTTREYLSSCWTKHIKVPFTTIQLKQHLKDSQKNSQRLISSLLKELGTFLKKNNFSWRKQTRCFNRIYFNKKGEIDYFLFDFPELEKVKEQEFKRLVNKFIETCKFPMTNGVKFAQCSPVKYSD